jgi:outer membrane protein TolC
MIYRYLLLLLIIVGVTRVQAQETMMGDISYPYLEKLIAAAKANYPRVKSYESKVHIAQMNVNKAKLDWFNIATFTYLYSPNNTPTLVNPTFTSGYQVGLATSIGNIVQKPGLIKAAREGYNIAKDDQDEYNMNLEAIVKARYFGYVQQVTMLNWRVKDMASAENSMNDMKHRFEKGEQNYENYNRAMEFYSNAIQLKIQAEGSLLIAKSSLEEIIGQKLEDIK